MNLIKKKKFLLKNLTATLTAFTLTMLNASMCLAVESGSTGIGTAEVQTATENIQRVITSIAMPLRWCSDFC